MEKNKKTQNEWIARIVEKTGIHYINDSTILVKDFGPKRKITGKYPEIAFSNAFIGNYLRCELLMLNGLKDQMFCNGENTNKRK